MLASFISLTGTPCALPDTSRLRRLPAVSMFSPHIISKPQQPMIIASAAFYGILPRTFEFIGLTGAATFIYSLQATGTVVKEGLWDRRAHRAHHAWPASQSAPCCAHACALSCCVCLVCIVSFHLSLSLHSMGPAGVWAVGVLHGVPALWCRQPTRGGRVLHTGGWWWCR